MRKLDLYSISTVLRSLHPNLSGGGRMAFVMQHVDRFAQSIATLKHYKEPQLNKAKAKKVTTA